MSKNTFFHILFRGVLEQDEPQLSEMCFEYGASGVSEELSFVQVRDDYQPEVIESGAKTLSGFFESMPSEEFFLRLEFEFPDVVVVKNEEENKDWMEEWKKEFKPFKLASPYWVVPTWLEKPEEADRPIWIDPGMAFGTGTHATTQMASELLVQLTTERSDFSVLDVGTGTGILAFLTRMQGASRVVGTEIDEDARRVARENTELNRLDLVEIPEKQIEQIDEQFDIVVANIIDGVLLKLKGQLFAKMKPGGSLVVSGILQEHESEFLSRFLDGTVLKVKNRLAKDEWIGLEIES